MKFLKTLSPLCLVALIGLAGCVDDPPLDPRSEIEIDGPTFNRQNAPGQQRRVGLDGEFARLNRDIPGFGGMFVDDAGKLNVYMSRGQVRAAEARQNVARQLDRALRASGRSAPLPHQIVVHEGDYEFLELARWNDQALPVLGLSGVVFTDIDESRNRLRIGIEEGTPEFEIQRALEALGVPAEVVTFETTGPIVPLADHTLRDRQHPLAGGLQLVMPHPVPGFVRLCTLGFNILREGRGRSENFFLTNSHCTESRGEVTGTPFYQQPIALPTERYLIGIEVEDPPFFDCPMFPGLICRYSDAAIVRYETRRTPTKFGSIYRTAFFGTGNSAGSLVVEQDDPKFFFIQDEEPFPMMGEMLDKVGRTTGWTRGPVINTCINTTPGLPIVMLCQDRVQANVAGGDSGSPVFQQSGDSKDATLYGILWGGSQLPTGEMTYVFSALENIRADFGNFRTH